MTAPKIGKKPQSSSRNPCVYRLKIQLRPNEIQPVIWRRLDVDGRVSLGKLHHFIQAAFGWSDAHLHEFEINAKTYRLPSPEDDFDVLEIFDERKAVLRQVAAEGDTFIYRYDFGDDWEHEMTVEDVILDEDSDLRGGAYVTEGARACPPEDVGGPDGYHEFLEMLLVDPRSEEAKQMREWAGGNFDPLHFDIRLANAAISRMMYNGWGGK
jgi:Plasmid pRiA4b ORF-3-like protein